MKRFQPSPFFNAHHSPVGAYATLTLGEKGARGGMGIGLGAPSCSSIVIGAESAEGDWFQSLPFFTQDAGGPSADDYSVDSPFHNKPAGPLRAYSDDAITRILTPCLDEWKAEDVVFRVFSPAHKVPNPALAGEDALKKALLPAVIAELVLDNSQGAKARKVFFGMSNPDRTAGMRLIQEEGLAGFTAGLHLAVVAQASGAMSATSFSPEQALRPVHPGHLRFGLGETAVLFATAEPGEVKTLRLAFCFHKPGIVTGGLEASYLYSRHFPSLSSVWEEAFLRFDQIKDQSKATDEALDNPGLNEAQRHSLVMAIKSYFGSTQLLEAEGQPLWLVNEGEYRMMNTFDLAADQLFFELAQNPWTVRSVLDQYRDRYLYRDEIGGKSAVAFTHDMGVASQFSPPTHSAYEIPGITGCFSYMSHEELVNWVVCAGLYLHETRDEAWSQANQSLFLECLESLELRDSLNPEGRDGIMSVDSPRCEGGAEITTYDSLDESLGQARASAYLALKTSAAYALLARIVEDEGAAARSKGQALKGMETLLEWQRSDGIFPALLQPDCLSFTLPVVEGLIFLDRGGLWEEYSREKVFQDLLAALKQHVDGLLSIGLCLFPDRGWKLSSTSRNSWLSKIYLCQHICRKLLGFGDLSAFWPSDFAHALWLYHPENTFWCWSDQMVAGIAHGSRYYPRGVTAILWLEEQGPES